MSNIKMIRTQSNEDVITEIVEEREDGYVLKNPCMIGQTEKGLGFFPWMPFADLEGFVLPRSEVRYAVNLKSELRNEYATVFSKLVVPDSGLKLVQ
jgi:hypothetical protein